MVFALLATLIVSLVVALLAALQLGDFFRAGDELLAVLIAVAGFAVLSITVLATGYRLAKRPRTLSAIAGGLALAATALALWPGTVERIAARSGAPLPAGFDDPPSLWSCWCRRCSRSWCNGVWSGGASCARPAPTI